MPQAEHDLRDTFASDLLGEEPAARPSGTKKPGGSSTEGIADAASLFADDDPKPRKRGPSAEDRAKARRCPSCGSVVPAGMSLCGRCGLDLDTGQRPVLDEILEAAPPPRAPSGPPLPISILGGLVLLASLGLCVYALIESARPGASQLWFLSIAAIGGFGVYAAIQFLRMKSARLLLIALLLGAIVDGVALIALPVYQANNVAPTTGGVAPVALADEELPKIENVANRLNVNKLQWGIANLLILAGGMIFLTTPAVKRSFDRSSRTSVPTLTGF